MIKLCDTVKNGRLGNKLMQNIGISVLAKKYNLFPEYHNIIENNLIGLDLFYGENKFDNYSYFNDDDLEHLLSKNTQINNGIIFSGYFQNKSLLLENANLIKQIIKKRKIKYHKKVFVHVRLGDVENSNPGILYYKNILNSIDFDSGFISSDCLNHPMVLELSNEYNLEIFDSTPIDTILTGSECEYRVVSGGTFSWFIGYLGDNDNVFAPKIPKFHGDIFVYSGWKLF
jgi:hypothetical protein